jgi:hypothetical protein
VRKAGTWRLGWCNSEGFTDAIARYYVSFGAPHLPSMKVSMTTMPQDRDGDTNGARTGQSRPAYRAKPTGWKRRRTVLEPSQERAVQRIVELKQRLADLQARLPAHSVPPAMMMEMEEIEEELAQLRTSLDSGKGCAAS